MTSSVIVLLLLAFGSVTSGPSDDPSIALELEAPEAQERLATVADHLPESTFGIAVIEVSAFTQSELWRSKVDSIMGKENYDAMIAEMRPVIEAEVGFDPMSVEWILIAATTDEQLIFAFGGLSTLADTLPRESFGGVEMVHMPSGPILYRPADSDMTLMALDEKGATDLAEVLNGQQQALSKGANHEKLSAFLQQKALLSGAALLDQGPLGLLLANGPAAGLDSLVFSIAGQHDLEISVHGAPESIQGLKTLYQQGVAMVQAELDQNYAKINEEPLEFALLMTTAKPLFEGLVELHSPSFEGGEASLQLDFPKTNPLIVLGSMSVISIAIPSFVKYTERTKSSAAVDEINATFDEIIALTHAHKDDCQAMAKALEEYGKAHQETLQAISNLDPDTLGPDDDKALSKKMRQLTQGLTECPEAMEAFMGMF